MMAVCLASSLTAEAQARFLTYCNEYTFDGVEYASLLSKIIMRLATINSIATTQTLRENLQNLEIFATTVNGDIKKIHSKFDTNQLQLLAHGATADNPIRLLCGAYSVIPCQNFKEYICHHHDDWLDGKLNGITLKTLTTFATRKCNYLKTKGFEGAKSPGDEKIVAMSAALNALKGHLRLDDKLGDIIKEGKGKGKRKGQGGNSKTKKKENTGNTAKQSRTRHGRRCLPSQETRRASITNPLMDCIELNC
jgi:hypothetical protein